MAMLTAERLREVLSYDPETGQFYRLTSGPGVRIGQVAGTKGNKGYCIIKIDGCSYKAHRLAWLYIHGHWPTMQIDHLNCIRDDNRIDNLREADNSQNQCNRRARQTNQTGFKGVYQKAHGKQYVAAVGRIYLGCFATPHAAHAAYAKASAVAYGEFARAE